MKKPQIIYLLLLSFLLFQSLFAAPEIKSAVDQSELTVGVDLTYSVSIALPEEEASSYSVSFPEEAYYADEEDKVPLYLIRDKKIESETVDGRVIKKVELRLVYLKPGTYELPALDIKDAEGIAVAYKLPQVSIKETNAGGQFEDIEPPIVRSGNYTRIALALLVLLVCGAACFFLIRYFMKRKKEKPEPQFTAAELFFDSYSKLQKKEYLENNEVEKFSTELSALYRKFLGEVYHFSAPDLTTDEIFAELNRRKVNTKRVEDIRKLMQLWDLTKFAELRPSAEIIETNLKLALSIVRQIDGEDSRGV